MFKIKKITNKAMDMNSYVLIKQKSMTVIDPGFNGKAILDLMKNKKYDLEAVLLTHGHYDHIRDIEMIGENQSFKVYIHAKDFAALYDVKKNYSAAFGHNFKLKQSIQVKQLSQDQVIHLLSEQINVMHTPGHTFGSVMYLYRNNVFSGDTIFYDSIGRTDLFSGNFNAIRRSLNKIKKSLSNNNKIWPGHGKNGLYKVIKEVNRYLK